MLQKQRVTARPCGQTTPPRFYDILLCGPAEPEAYEMHLALAGIADKTGYITIVSNVDDLGFALRQMRYDLAICCRSAEDDGGRHLASMLKTLEEFGGRKQDVTVCNPPPVAQRHAAAMAADFTEVNACQHLQCPFNQTAQVVFFDAGNWHPSPLDRVRPQSCPLRLEAATGQKPRNPSD